MTYMRPLAIDAEAVVRLAAAKGIDTTRDLAGLAGMSENVLYKGLRIGYLLPSHVKRLAEALGVERDEILSADEEVSA